MPDLSTYRFAKTHEWVHPDGDDIVVGISEHAQAQLGDVIFIDLPKVGTKLTVGQSLGVIESVKAASDLYAPVSGTVSAINDTLSSAPEQVNNDPYGAGWMLRLSHTKPNDDLVDEAEYNTVVGE